MLSLPNDAEGVLVSSSQAPGFLDRSPGLSYAPARPVAKAVLNAWWTFLPVVVPSVWAKVVNATWWCRTKIVRHPVPELVQAPFVSSPCISFSRCGMRFPLPPSYLVTRGY
jgi:hypothetical protein